MELSQQLYTADMAEGWKGIYSPFKQRVAFLYDDAWQPLSRGDVGVISAKMRDYLVESCILVEPGFEEKWRAHHRERISKDVRLTSMYLVTTQRCNFECRYCAVMENLDSPTRQSERMSIEVGKAAVRFFETHLRRQQPRDARVTFYGGEPTLNPKLISALVPEIASIRYPGQAKPVEIVMITNGYCYHDRLTELFKKHSVGVCLSLDGTRRHQDVTRVTRKSHRKTFDRVITNFKKYQRAGLSMGISVALGRHNVFDLKEISHFFGTELAPPFVEFQIPYQVADESNEFYISTELASQYVTEAYEILRSYGIIEGLTYRRLRDFATGTVRYRDCGASANQLVVAPDGSIGPCHSLVGTRKFFDGNVLDSECDATSMPNFMEWANRYPLNMPECEACPFISLCGGGCPYNSYVSRGTIWAKDPQVCTYMNSLVDWILRDIWKETGMAAKYGGSGPRMSH